MSKNLEICTVENPHHRDVLTNVARDVTFPLKPEVLTFIHQLKEKLLEIAGVGLAAPQVGVPLKIVAIHISEFAAAIRDHAQPVPMTVLINPRYEPISEARDFEDWEGCFSVNNFMGKIPRFFRIRYIAQDEEGREMDAIAEGFWARVLQHEIDHVDGRLLTDRVRPDSIKGPMQDMIAMRKAELSDERQKIYDEITNRQKNRR